MEKAEQEHAKTDVSTPIPSVPTEEVALDYDHDHALALSLQQQEQQEGDFPMLETAEDDETEDDEELDEEEGSYLSSSSSAESDGGIFFTSQELAELEVLDQEEQANMELEEEIVEDEEDDIDPDELSYEELVELGETVGQENQGLTPEEISSSLTPYICKSIHSNTGIDRCVICQAEYEEGEGLVALRCEHPFHEDCIKRWLQIKKTCPICSKEANEQKTE